ncbi:Kinesin-like protein KIN-14L [Ancistrocladus abbreviatus]
MLRVEAPAFVSFCTVTIYIHRSVTLVDERTEIGDFAFLVSRSEPADGMLVGDCLLRALALVSSGDFGSSIMFLPPCGPSGGLTKDMGINYFALNDLFQLSNKRKDIISYNIYVQMVEIYDEQVRDLLAEDSSSTKYPLSWLDIRSHHTSDGLSRPDATLHSVKSIVGVLNLMKHGDKNRADTSGNILHSRLYLVDLAGSERVDKSEVTGDRLKEAQHINKSPSCLGDVFTGLSQKSSYIPYRNSKLTLLLQDALGGHAKTLMFAHVSPEGDDFGETLSTLKFARRVSGIELGAACLNKWSSEVRELKQQDSYGNIWSNHLCLQTNWTSSSQQSKVFA